jgi:hypothetical protein
MGAAFDKSYDYLHGAVEDGIPCTLVGNFQLSNSGFSFKLGHSYHTHDKYPFQYVIFGGHFDSLLKVSRFGFNLSGIQEFFAPASAKKFTPFVKGNVYEADVGDCHIAIQHLGLVDFVPSNLSALIHSTNKSAVEELQAAFDNIKARHPDFRPLIKQDISYTFSVRNKKDLSIPECIQIATKYADLFSLLAHNPRQVADFTILLEDQDHRWHEFPVLYAGPIQKDVLDRSLEEGDYHQLPLNASHINLPKVLRAWSDKSSEFSTPISAIQNTGKFFSYHDTISSIVLNATQLEAISYARRKKDDKFGYPIRLLASKKSRAKLRNLLKCTDKQIGSRIADLRNEIAHVGRPKVHLSSLTSKDLFKVCRILESTVLVHALRQLGVSKASTHYFQDRIAR